MNNADKMAKVLVVEDNDLNLKLFHDLLAIKNYDIITLKDGKLAFDIVKTEQPDLILMDIQLGGISGLDIIHALKQESSTAQIPIIAVTAFAMTHDEVKIMQSGCDMYISKPVSINHFFDAISKFLE